MTARKLPPIIHRGRVKFALLGIMLAGAAIVGGKMLRRLLPPEYLPQYGTIDLLYNALWILALGGLLFWQMRKERRLWLQAKAARGCVCGQCGYSLLGLPEQGKCPECGTKYDSRTQSELLRFERMLW